MNINLLKLFFVFLISLGLISCASQEVKGDKEGIATEGESVDLEAAGEEESFKIRSAVRDLENKSGDSDESEGNASSANRDQLKSWAADELMLTRVYFKYNDDSLDSGGKDIIALHVDFMKEYPEVNLQLHGHADERGTQEYNLALGDRRGNSVAKVLLDNGIAADRIVVISFGENRPVDEAHEENAWAKNRRVEFLYE